MKEKVKLKDLNVGDLVLFKWKFQATKGEPFPRRHTLICPIKEIVNGKILVRGYAFNMYDGLEVDFIDGHYIFYSSIEPFGGYDEVD
jgi:hypothetical protein